MNWLHLEEVLREYEAYLLEASKRNMPSYYELRNNIKFNLQVEDNFYEIVFVAPQYWKWAEDGRRPGKMPPVSAIADWVTRRKIAHVKLTQYQIRHKRHQQVVLYGRMLYKCLDELVGYS